MTANLPWRPQLVFTGQSDYVVDASGLVVKHIDYWDSLQDSAFFSVGGLGDLLALCSPGKVSTTECGGFDVLRRTDVLQIRRFRGKGVRLRQKGEAEWEVVENGADCVVQLVAAKGIGRKRGKEELMGMKEYLNKVPFAQATSRAFVVAVPARGRVVKEAWVELATVSVAVDGL